MAVTETTSACPASKGLKVGAPGLLGSIVVGVASTAPAYGQAASLGYVVVVPNGDGTAVRRSPGPCGRGIKPSLSWRGCACPTPWGAPCSLPTCPTCPGATAVDLETGREIHLEPGQRYVDETPEETAARDQTDEQP